MTRSISRWLRRAWPSLFGVGIAALLVILLALLGWKADTENTLQVMGFDPDRAVLLSALLGGAIAAAATTFAGGRPAVAVVTGVLGVGAWFWPVFRRETGAALRARGPDGAFDPIGWAATAITLGATAIVVAWAATTLAATVRRFMVDAARSVRLLARSRRPDRSLAWRPVVVAVVGVVLLIVSPILGDMLNYDPDVRMRTGGARASGLFGGGAGAVGADAGGTTTTVAGQTLIRGPDGYTVGGLTFPGDLGPGPLSDSLVAPGALASPTPWATHPPVGGGRVLTVALPGPWTGGLTPDAEVDVYLPPGYDRGAGRYPTIYIPQQSQPAWDASMHVTALLDSLITSGAIPPEVVVFMPQRGGPYADSECADSWDGREWYDRYVAATVVPWVDGHVRTIASAEARALLGFSSGGYCSAALLAHHPDVFTTSAVFSGYFVAGVHSGTTPVAWRPFNDDPAIIERVSPITVVPRIPASLRSRLMFLLSFDPLNHFYGPQAARFAAMLDQSKVALAILPAALAHSWSTVRQQLPGVLAMIAARQEQLGVFGPGAG